MLKHFKIDRSRVAKVVDVAFYQMGLKSIVDLAKTDELFTEDNELPSWSKFAAAPPKGKGFFVRMLEAIFLGAHGADELNVDLQTEEYDANRTRVAMMFMPGSIRNESLGLCVSYAKQALPGYEVIAICGDETTNAKAEALAKDAIDNAKRNGKSVLMLSAGMAQRSFSVPEITELYLAYDSGDNGATIQKMSRALTPDEAGKVGRIFSLSFDPNRDDKFDAMMIETAMNYKKTHDKKSMKEAFSDVLRTIDIFSCQPQGAVKISPDAYLEQAMARKSISRVAGKIADITLLSNSDIIALAKGNDEYFKAGKTETADKGKTRDNPKKAADKKHPVDDKKVTEKQIAKAKAVIVAIVENMDVIIYGTEAKTVNEAFAIMDESPEWHAAIKEEFGVEFYVISHLFKNGVINTDIVQLMYDEVVI